MPSIETLASEKAGYESRLTAALAAIAERIGAPAPKVRHGGRLAELPPVERGQRVAEAATLAYLAEAIAALAERVETLEARKGGKLR